MQYSDAHCHLADPRLDSIREEVIARAERAGITQFVMGGVDPEDWDRQVRLASQIGPKGCRIHCAFGLHPWWVATHSESEAQAAFKKLETRFQNYPQAVALGEIGLDFLPRFSESTHALQKQLFAAQLALAAQLAKPVILHVVRAHEPVLDLLKSLRPGDKPYTGLMHSFSGDLQIANRYIELGFLISIGGALTRDGHKGLKAAARKLPLDKIVLESDSPDQPSQRFLERGLAGPGGRLNEPICVLEIAEVLGRLRGVPADTLLRQSTDNLRNVFQF